MHSEQIPDPVIFMLPLAVPHPQRFKKLDPGVLSRRLPDFLHQMINQGENYPTGMLEIQSAPHLDQPIEWVLLQTPPDPEEAFSMLPEGDGAEAVVTGTVDMVKGKLELDLNVHFRMDLGTGMASSVQCMVSLEDPVPSLERLSKRLAKILDVEFHKPMSGLLTTSGLAFFKFLEGLDGSALLSGDLAIKTVAEPEALMQPYSEALNLDPRFGLALRFAHLSLASALHGERIGAKTCYKVIDRCLTAMPVDGDACVQVAEHMAVLGDDKRAIAWLQHAAHLNPPPPRGLERLGILFANSGKTVEARNLWLNGLSLDGHPDFFAHLARLAFTEGSLDEAWDKVVRGLRRIYERTVRMEEWGAEDQDMGLLLRYLVEHLPENPAPPEVEEALMDLRGKLAMAEDRIDLGLCLMSVGMPLEAAEEIQSGLLGDPDLVSDPHASIGDGLDPQVRDQGVRALLTMQVEKFERRFARAADNIATRRDLDKSAVEMTYFLSLQPDFWPALFFLAVARRRQDKSEEALDHLADVLRLRPGQAEALQEMAELFAKRGNPKRALECIDDALDSRPEDARWHGYRSSYLAQLGRLRDARQALQTGLDLEPSNLELKRIQQQLEKGS